MLELLFMAYPCILVVVKRDDRSPNRGARHFEVCMTIFDLYGSGSGEYFYVFAYQTAALRERAVLI